MDAAGGPARAFSRRRAWAVFLDSAGATRRRAVQLRAESARVTAGGVAHPEAGAGKCGARNPSGVKGGVYQVLTTDVAGTRAPRVDVNEPEKSLVLMKATAAVTHGGGQRFDRDSADYRTILEWVRSGAPYGTEGSTEPKLARLEVYPSMIAVPVGSRHGVLVTAVSATRAGGLPRRRLIRTTLTWLP